MLLNVKHETVFSYSAPVAESCMEFRLTPATDANQKVISHRREVRGARTIRQHMDSWGNTVSYFTISAPHTEVEVVFESVVETASTPWRPRGMSDKVVAEASPFWQETLYDWLYPTPLTGDSPQLDGYLTRFRGLDPSNVEQTVEAVREDIYSHFRYDTESTTTATTAQDLLRLGGGVCQDFSHLMIAVLRRLGVPARYVSGYVVTDSWEEAALASHAWVEALDVHRGWLGADPTHNRWAEGQHIRIGVGRDYADVPPNKGVYRGNAVEEVAVRVFLRPLEADQLESSARRLFAASRAPYATRQRSAPRQEHNILQAMQMQQQQG